MEKILSLQKSANDGVKFRFAICGASGTGETCVVLKLATESKAENIGRDLPVSEPPVFSSTQGGLS
jgi:hypothetical protein